MREARAWLDRLGGQDCGGEITAAFAAWADAGAHNPAAFGAACRERLDGIDAERAGPPKP